MHDSKIFDWGRLYDRMEETYDRNGGKVVVNSTFCRENYEYPIKYAQYVTMADGPLEVSKLGQETPLGQSAEWGMRAFQGTFPRLKDRFYY